MPQQPFGISPSQECHMMTCSGFYLVFPSAEVEPGGASYVRFIDHNGGEIAYWVCDEWAEEPEYVMGAILGTMSVQPVNQTEPKFYRFADDVIFPDHVVLDDE